MCDATTWCLSILDHNKIAELDLNKCPTEDNEHEDKEKKQVKSLLKNFIHKFY